LRDIEVKLISELMKDSRRSDRELVRVLGISQPTVGRMIKRLEKDGVINEYTMIPDLSRLGIDIVAFTFGV
jgi:DNA-binding Lrp family transcriptional regulator